MSETQELIDSSFELNSSGYIVDKAGKIYGRASGYGPGTGWYQLAGRPHDEQPVGGFDSIDEAFAAACAELQTRRRNS